MAGRATPPFGCFFGERSLSLTLADFGTFRFFVSVDFFDTCMVLVSFHLIWAAIPYPPGGHPDHRERFCERQAYSYTKETAPCFSSFSTLALQHRRPRSAASGTETGRLRSARLSNQDPDTGFNAVRDLRPTRAIVGC
jgi:hypothetical protein